MAGPRVRASRKGSATIRIHPSISGLFTQPCHSLSSQDPSFQDPGLRFPPQSRRVPFSMSAQSLSICFVFLLFLLNSCKKVIRFLLNVAARIREILEHVGLAQEGLPSNVVGSVQVLANVANLLNIRDTELSRSDYAFDNFASGFIYLGHDWFLFYWDFPSVFE